MAYQHSDIIEHLAEVTSSDDIWTRVCERALYLRRLGSRRRYERWIQLGCNQVRKRTYMQAYDRTPKRMEAKRLCSARARAAKRKAPAAASLCLPRHKVPESKEARHARYLRAKATGYLS